MTPQAVATTAAIGVVAWAGIAALLAAAIGAVIREADRQMEADSMTEHNNSLMPEENR